MSLGTILIIVLILMLIGALPNWPHAVAFAVLKQQPQVTNVIKALVTWGQTVRSRAPTLEPHHYVFLPYLPPSLVSTQG